MVASFAWGVRCSYSFCLCNFCCDYRLVCCLRRYYWCYCHSWDAVPWLWKNVSSRSCCSRWYLRHSDPAIDTNDFVWRYYWWIGRSVVYVRRCTGGYFDTAVYCCGCLQLKKAAFAGSGQLGGTFSGAKKFFLGTAAAGACRWRYLYGSVYSYWSCCYRYGLQFVYYFCYLPYAWSEGYAGNFAGYSQNDFDDFRDYDRRNFIWFRFNYSAGSAGFDEPGCRNGNQPVDSLYRN